jgi:hypothetical protein
MEQSGKSNRFVEYEANNITKLSRLAFGDNKEKELPKFQL